MVKVVRSGRMVVDDKIDGASKNTASMIKEYNCYDGRIHPMVMRILRRLIMQKYTCKDRIRPIKMRM